MIKRNFFYIIIYLMFFSSFILACASVPMEVKEEMAQIKQAKETKKALEKQIIRVPVAELRQNAKENFSVENGVFQFHGDVIFPACENVYLLELKVNDEIFSNLDENIPLIMNYMGENESDWQKYVTQEQGVCFLETDKMYASVKQTGGLNIHKTVSSKEHPYFFTIDGKITEQYYFINNRESTLNQEIDFNGKKVDLKTLNTSFEKGMQLINACSPGLSLILHDARIVEENGTGKKMIVFRALSNYKGVCFDPNYIFPQNSNAMNGKSFVGFEMNQQIHELGDGCSTDLRETSYLVTKEIKEYSALIDFNSARYIMEQTVPNDKITLIESAEFMYQIYYEGNMGVNWEYATDESTLPSVFYATPVWRFVEKERPNETKATVYYVDAVTGEVYSFYQACTP